MYLIEIYEDGEWVKASTERNYFDALQEAWTLEELGYIVRFDIIH